MVTSHCVVVAQSRLGVDVPLLNDPGFMPPPPSLTFPQYNFSLFSFPYFFPPLSLALAHLQPIPFLLPPSLTNSFLPFSFPNTPHPPLLFLFHFASPSSVPPSRCHLLATIPVYLSPSSLLSLLSHFTSTFLLPTLPAPSRSSASSHTCPVMGSPEAY